MKVLALCAGLFLLVATSAASGQEAPLLDLSPASAPIATSGDTEPSQQMIEDRIRAITRQQMVRCWRMPVDGNDTRRLIVTVHVDLRPDGTLEGEPRAVSPRHYLFDASMREAVEAALRGVRACAPYPFATDPVVSGHYELWRHMELTFMPSPTASQ